MDIGFIHKKTNKNIMLFDAKRLVKVYDRDKNDQRYKYFYMVTDSNGKDQYFREEDFSLFLCLE